MDHDANIDQLNRVFAALSDPTRRAIVKRLSHGKATATELGAPFALSQPTISRHLKVLEQAGLISMERSAQQRIREIDHNTLRRVDEWIEPFRSRWATRLDRLEQHLGSIEGKNDE